MSDDDLNRRSFLAACAACATCPVAIWAAADAPARKDGDRSSKEPVDAGKLSDYPKDGVYDKFAKDEGFFIVREKDRLFAPSSHCTHRATAIAMKGEEFVCPKHGARFTRQGIVTRGPAKRPLPRYAIAVDDDGKITVDPSKTFDKDKWDDKSSYVPVKT